MKIAFTICSASYLGYAKSLADSLVQHNPGYRFYIALLDTWQDYEPSFFSPHTIVPVTGMQLAALPELAARYNVFELSCALKPYVAEYLFQTQADCEAVFYFDSDILVYNRLTLAEDLLTKHSLLLTPHLGRGPLSDALLPTELTVLRSGIYNAGFFGLSRSEESFRFLTWWKERLRQFCIDDFKRGFFVDQLWLNHAPVLFSNTFVLYDPGYNLAYWNFPQRRLSKKDGNYFVNVQHPLVFFHYSGYDMEKPDLISKHQPEYTFRKLPDYQPLFENYRKLFLQNEGPHFSELPTTLGQPPQPPPPREKNFFKRKFKKIFKQKP